MVTFGGFYTTKKNFFFAGMVIFCVGMAESMGSFQCLGLKEIGLDS